MNEFTGSKGLLDYITATATASSDDDVDYLLRLMRPTADREEMSEVYNKVLGYNPITYFDKEYMHHAFAEIVLRAPLAVQENLKSIEDHVVNEAMARFDETRDDYLFNLLASVISDETGWIDPVYCANNEDLLAEDSSESARRDGFEIEGDDDEEDFDEESDDDEDDLFSDDGGDDE